MQIQNIEAFEAKFDAVMAPPKVETNANGALFTGMMGGLDTMRATQETGKLEMAQVLLGNSENAHSALIQLEKANLQMSFASAIRDKATQGINQMLHMQV